MAQILLRAENLRTWFDIRRGIFSKPVYVKAVDDVNFELREEEAISLVGESGSGKTTLGKTLLRLYRPTGGKIFYKDMDITNAPYNKLRWYRREAQIIYQDPFSSIAPFFTVYKALEEPLIINKIGNSNERSEMIYKALEAVKLTPVEIFASKYPHMLSGGQRQRVVIARALIMQPKYIVADEPVTMLDASVRVEILYLLRELQQKYKISFVYITHDLATSRYFSERVAIMYAGKIIETGNVDEVIQKPLHPYTQALLEGIPDPEPENRKVLRKVPSGEPPSLIFPPPGCRFHPRCPYAMDVCKEREPELRELKDGHITACHYAEIFLK
ncbi:MAG: ABC transporter ATP-binding protein [Candidatus Bathyarchaeia archaeon]